MKSVPWKQIVLSKKVHGLWITHLSSAWGYYLLAISLPTFSEEVLKLSVINVRKFGHKLRQVLFFVNKIENNDSSEFSIFDRMVCRLRYLTLECLYLPRLESCLIYLDHMSLHL